jgi:hypothetical protein
MPAGPLQGSPLQGLRVMTYPEFWRRYLAAHADPRTRGLHYLGTFLAMAALATAAGKRDWRWLAAAPVGGYALAWLGHVKFEHNRPETFGHPAWSLVSDFRMLGMFLSGRLGNELRSAGVGEASDDGAADRIQ